MTKDARSSRLDWLNFALDVLIKQGPEQLKIASLCQLKGVSKGSFYHHFANRAEFVDNLMEHWYQTTTDDFITQANSQSSPLARLQALDTLIAGHNLETETHIRAWALEEPSIAVHLAKIDGQRQAYLAKTYIELGLTKSASQDLATATYASFLGMQQLYPRPTVEKILEATSYIAKNQLGLIND